VEALSTLPCNGPPRFARIVVARLRPISILPYSWTVSSLFGILRTIVFQRFRCLRYGVHSEPPKNPTKSLPPFERCLNAAEMRQNFSKTFLF
jgi:hypothetical protein